MGHGSQVTLRCSRPNQLLYVSNCTGWNLFSSSCWVAADGQGKRSMATITMTNSKNIMVSITHPQIRVPRAAKYSQLNKINQGDLQCWRTHLPTIECSRRQYPRTCLEHRVIQGNHQHSVAKAMVQTRCWEGTCGKAMLCKHDMQMFPRHVHANVYSHVHVTCTAGTYK